MAQYSTNLSIAVSRPHPVLLHDPLKVRMSMSHLGVEIPHDNNEIISWYIFCLFLHLAVEVIFAIVAAVIGRCIALDDGDVGVPSPQSQTNQSVADRLPLHHTSLQALFQDEGYSLVVPIFLQENRMVSLVLVFNLPVPVHLHSLTSKICRLYLLISLFTCVSFPVSHIVLTFQNPILVLVFALGPPVAHLSSSSWWESEGVVLVSPGVDRAGMVVFIAVSVRLRFLPVGVVSPELNTQTLMFLFGIILGITTTHTRVTSRIPYCNSLLFGLPQSTINRLQMMQNKAAHVITRTKKNDHITPVLQSLHWLTTTVYTVQPLVI